MGTLIVIYVDNGSAGEGPLRKLQMRELDYELKNYLWRNNAYMHYCVINSLWAHNLIPV